MKSVFKTHSKSKNSKTKCKNHSKMRKNKQSKRHKIKGGDMSTDNGISQESTTAQPNQDLPVVTNEPDISKPEQDILPSESDISKPEQSVLENDPINDTQPVIETKQPDVNMEQSNPEYSTDEPQNNTDYPINDVDNYEMPKSGCNCEIDCPSNSSDEKPESKKSLLNSMFSSIQSLFNKPKDNNTNPNPTVGGKKSKSKKCKKQNRVKKNKSSVKKQK